MTAVEIGMVHSNNDELRGRYECPDIFYFSSQETHSLFSLTRPKYRWGPIPSTAIATDNAEPAPKRKRKSRWEDKPAEPAADDSKALMLFPNEVILSNGLKIHLPPTLTGQAPGGNPELVPLYRDLAEIERKLRTNDINLPPEHERSPSPPPMYDSNGIRLNTREVRIREKLERQRNVVIEDLIKKDPKYKPPADWKPEKKTRKIYIPVKEFPGYNFIGLIIGPRGNTQKRMQNETNCRIAIRGRGSMKEGVARNPNSDYGEDDELHVLVIGDTDEEVDKAAAMVEKLIQPMDEEMNEHKKLQLRELAMINGTLKEENSCFLCGDTGHRQIDCPKKALDVYRLPDAIQAQVEEQYARDVARMNPGESGHIDAEYKSFLAELGGNDPRGPGGIAAGIEVGGNGRLPDSCKLYVGNLAPTVDDTMLRQHFEQFGSVAHVSVLYDAGTGAPRGFGFVHYLTEQEARAACNASHDFILEGRPLQVRVRSDPRDDTRRAGIGSNIQAARPDDNLPAACKLYIGNLPYHIDEFVLHREFEKFGPLVSCRIPVDRETGRPKGFAFLSYSDPQMAATAIAYMDGYLGFDPHRPIIVRIAGKPQQPGPPPPQHMGGGHMFPPPPYDPAMVGYGYMAPPGDQYPPPPLYDPHQGHYYDPSYAPPPPPAMIQPEDVPPPPPPPVEGELPPPPPPPPAEMVAQAPVEDDEYQKFMAEMANQLP